MIHFRNDYSAGAHPAVMDALCKTNLELTAGYGEDPYCAKAADRVRAVCACPQADVHFLVGGTQTNKTTLGAFLRTYEAVIAADTGHICVHETGAIEQNGHKIIACPSPDGKLTPAMIRAAVDSHSSEHMVVPRGVYISNTTEVGTVYSLAELKTISAICRELGLFLYCDGARLGSAMTVQGADTSFADYAALCDAFTIGGTKNGLLFGEALVLMNPELDQYFRNSMKQQGSILAKGRLFGVQYETILTDGLYMELAEHAYRLMAKLAAGLKDMGYTFRVDSPSNQIFPVLTKDKVETLKKSCAFEIIEEVDDEHDCIRFVTSWATTEEDVDALLFVMSAL